MSTAQWANIGEDAGALHALVQRLPEHVATDLIDHLWIFPARRIAIGESIVIVMAAFDEAAERRRVSTAHFTVARDRKGVPTVNVRFDEHGSALVAVVPRIVQGVLRRLGEDLEASPREVAVGGDPQKWSDLVVELGGRIPDPAAPQSSAAAAHDPVPASEPDPPSEPESESRALREPASASPD